MPYKTCSERKKERLTINGQAVGPKKGEPGKSSALFAARKLLGAQAHVWKDGRGCCVGRYKVKRVSFGEGATWKEALVEARKNFAAQESLKNDAE